MVYLGFQCLNANCQEFIFEEADKLEGDFSITCPSCGCAISSGGQAVFYDYDLVDLRDGSTIESGQFEIAHVDYIRRCAGKYKYCIVCNTMQPLGNFDAHSARRSGRQGECRNCKTKYNQIKNKTRIADQHRESGEKRRILVAFAGQHKIDSSVVYERFGHRCFKCGTDLKGAGAKDKPLDHTIPVKYLWPLSTETATLLCRNCNSVKTGKWPVEVYSEDQLRELALKTAIPLELLRARPVCNPEAIAKLKDPGRVNALLKKHILHIRDVFGLRNRIKRDLGIDFFQYSTTLCPELIAEADRARTDGEDQGSPTSEGEGTDEP